MAQILPLRGIRYTSAAGEFGSLLAPPYDVISPAQHEALRRSSRYNAVHVELAGEGEDRYAAVARRFDSWIEHGTVARDQDPMLYVYEQDFRYEGRAHTRRALLTGVEVQPWEEGAVKPHEYTMSGPKADRLALLQATRTQFSPLFMIARDRAGQLQQFMEDVVTQGEPLASGTSLDGDNHRLWTLPAGPLEMRRLAPLFAESFYLADGHHRYETAQAYREWLTEREGALDIHHPARYVMTDLVPASDPGLIIRPIYRSVARKPPADWRARLERTFHIEELGVTAGDEAFEARARTELGSEDSVVVALGLEPGNAFLLRKRTDADLAAVAPAGYSAGWAATPPNLCRLAILNPLWDMTDDDLRAGAVEFVHDIPEAVERANAGAVVFLIQPVGIREVVDLSDKGERMPQKSTFFHPKMGTGLVFNPLYS
jgi:uncharacterized protein (DUF1015 family)